MSVLTLELHEGKTAFRPGEAIGGQARWQLDELAEAIEIRLFWYTEGKGDQDVGLVGTARVDGPGLEGRHEFSFAAPRAPHSFSGRLITLLWALELVVLPGEETKRQALVIAPEGEEILLAPASEVVGAGPGSAEPSDEGSTFESLPGEAFDGAKPLEPS